MLPKDKFEQVTITLSKQIPWVQSIPSHVRIDVKIFENSDLLPPPYPFSLEPIAYEFPKGHSVRLRFTGADAHNFYIESMRWAFHIVACVSRSDSYSITCFRSGRSSSSSGGGGEEDEGLGKFCCKFYIISWLLWIVVGRQIFFKMLVAVTQNS